MSRHQVHRRHIEGGGNMQGPHVRPHERAGARDPSGEVHHVRGRDTRSPAICPSRSRATPSSSGPANTVSGCPASRTAPAIPTSTSTGMRFRPRPPMCIDTPSGGPAGARSGGKKNSMGPQGSAFQMSATSAYRRSDSCAPGRCPPRDHVAVHGARVLVIEADPPRGPGQQHHDRVGQRRLRLPVDHEIYRSRRSARISRKSRRGPRRSPRRSTMISPDTAGWCSRISRNVDDTATSIPASGKHDFNPRKSGVMKRRFPIRSSCRTTRMRGNEASRSLKTAISDLEVETREIKGGSGTSAIRWRTG